jgi:hypothetical protein
MSLRHHVQVTHRNVQHLVICVSLSSCDQLSYQYWLECRRLSPRAGGRVLLGTAHVQFKCKRADGMGDYTAAYRSMQYSSDHPHDQGLLKCFEQSSVRSKTERGIGAAVKYVCG